MSAGDQFLAVSLDTDPELGVSTPVPLFQQPYDQGYYGYHSYYDVASDGEHFLVVSDTSTTEFQVVQNWFEELKRLVPTPCLLEARFTCGECNTSHWRYRVI